MKPLDLALVLLVTSIWALSFPVAKIGLLELPPLLFAATRFLLVALPAILFLPRPATAFFNVVAIGTLLGIVKFGLVFFAMREEASAGLASLILQLQVPFTIALSFLFFREPVLPQHFVGIGLAAAGFMVFATFTGGNISLLGLGMILLAAIAWALANMLLKRMAHVDLLSLMVWASLIPPIPLLLASLLIESGDPVTVLRDLSVTGWLNIAYMSLCSTLIAYAVWGRLLQRYPAAQIAPWALLIPVLGIASSNLLLEETLTPTEVFGTLMVMGGLIVCVATHRLRAVVRWLKRGTSA